MTAFVVTNTFVTGSSITASGHNTNWSDLATWLNNRYNGIDTWSYMKVSSTDANPVDITSSGAATELSLNNTAADGDPLLTFKLSGSQIHVIGINDSDNDVLNFATTGISTNISMQIPSTGSQVLFNVGSASVPGISYIGDTDTGFFWASSGDIRVTTNGSTALFIRAADVRVGTGIPFQTDDGTAGAPSHSFFNSPTLGTYRSGSNQFSIATNGVETARFDASVTATHTRFMIYDVDNATLERVTVGASDSGGSGFKVLRIPN